MISGFHTGDLNPIWTVPMLGTHKLLELTASVFLLEVEFCAGGSSALTFAQPSHGAHHGMTKVSRATCLSAGTALIGAW